MKGKHISQSHADKPFDQKSTGLVKYSRVILKISGEILKTENNIVEPHIVQYIVEQVASCGQLGIRLGIVIGGGNIVRGRDMRWLNKIDADICGMMATVINGITIASKLNEMSINARLSSGIEISGVVPRANVFTDLEHFDRGTVLIFIGGTGNPLFTTDTAAALRAAEYRADILIKATKVEGTYSADPEKNSNAKFYKQLTYEQVIAENLRVMDLTAFALCRDSRIPMCVYNFLKYPLSKIIQGHEIGTLITNGG